MPGCLILITQKIYNICTVVYIATFSILLSFLRSISYFVELVF